MTLSLSSELIDAAVEKADRWQERANRLLTAEEKAQQQQMMRLLDRPADKVVLAKLFDQGFRSIDPARVADQINYLLRTHGVPAFFSDMEKALVMLFKGIGRHLPGVSIPKMIDRMRASSRHLIVPGERRDLHAYLSRRRRGKVRVNINHLGEALLGEDEAARRLDAYRSALEDPAVTYVSVKISTLYSQIRPLAFDQTVDVLVQRLGELYQAALDNPCGDDTGRSRPKFVNLDMEEYRDLPITVAAFRKALDRPAFADLSAGIVLQAYLPDAHAIQRELTDWAMARVNGGGAPIKVRIVKGANMAMEKIDAAHHGWPLAPYDNKPDVDANYKRMLVFGMQPDHIGAVRLGVASHNLFDLALADVLARYHGVGDSVTFEMLEGMAPHVRRVLAEQGRDVLVYAPVADEKNFLNAIAYLIRRMDENTGPQNFLRHMPGLTAGSPAWQDQEDRFRKACGRIDALEDTPHRDQDRTRSKDNGDVSSWATGVFINEPDTDWTLSANRQWARDIRNRWQKAAGDDPEPVPVVVDDRDIFEGRQVRDNLDPNPLPEKVIVARTAMADAKDIETAVATARRDPDGWRQMSAEARHRVLSAVAAGLRAGRGDLIGAAAANTGKLFDQADPEVSEAVDFAEFYPLSARRYMDDPNLRAAGKGVVAVVAPWNFPIAIACGGIAAALAAGNTVIFKPSSDASLVAWRLCRIFWEAGVSRRTLQFLPCRGSDAGRLLIPNPDVDAVILTGGTDTGMKMLAARPGLFLAAETGGKNATIVTAMADRDQAIANVIDSAFGHSGQKCSATSLLICEAEVYDDPEFKRQLVDAAASLKVGPAWDFSARMGPLIRPPADPLRHALTHLENGATWALQPRNIDDNPHLWTPGIKWDVAPGGSDHRVEFFGPLLGVMRADDLEQAVDLANDTGYGLTAGLESLDPREMDYFRQEMRAGNLYINRGTTGAIVLRQPFGGMGKSAVGPAVKAGGPHYVSQFMTFAPVRPGLVGAMAKDHDLLQLARRCRRNADRPSMRPYRHDLQAVVPAVESYLYWYQAEFGRRLDTAHLRGQDNLLRFLPVQPMLIRVVADDRLFDVLARLAAARIAGCKTILSLPPELDSPAAAFFDTAAGGDWLAGAELRRQSDDDLVRFLPRLARIRFAAPDRVPAALYPAAAKTGFYIARAPVAVDGRIELLHYLLNQSICHSYHRYGNLGERARELAGGARAAADRQKERPS